MFGQFKSPPPPPFSLVQPTFQKNDSLYIQNQLPVQFCCMVMVLNNNTQVEYV